MSNIIGLTSTTKILAKSSLTRESSGIQTLSQTIVTTRAGASVFTPKLLDPHPDFPTMAVESVTTDFMSGGLAEIDISYVGLIQKGAEQYVSLPTSQIPPQPKMLQTFRPDFFPKPNYNLRQNPAVTIYFPYIVELQFIDIQNQRRLKFLSNTFNPKERTKIPLQWRGSQLPSTIGLPFSSVPEKDLIYYGIICRSIDFRKRGFFSEVTVSFSESYTLRGVTV